jgi:hypothetical protein
LGYVLLLLVLVVLLAVLLPVVIRGAASLSRSRREAERRAQHLLSEMLSSEELTELSQKGYLRVRSPSRENRVYHVPQHQGMVSVYEAGALSERLCVGATSYIPEGDTVLMHKLMIEGDEEEYLRVANHFPPRPYSFQV